MVVVVPQAKLFYTETHLTMITTEAIASNEQIVSSASPFRVHRLSHWALIFCLSFTTQFNTYARPPNSDLLRRYGHVDVIPPSQVGNEEDEIEIRCDVAVECALEFLRETKAVESGKEDKWGMEERVDFWLQEGGDE